MTFGFRFAITLGRSLEGCQPLDRIAAAAPLSLAPRRCDTARFWVGYVTRCKLPGASHTCVRPASAPMLDRMSLNSMFSRPRCGAKHRALPRASLGLCASCKCYVVFVTLRVAGARVHMLCPFSWPCACFPLASPSAAIVRAGFVVLGGVLGCRVFALIGSAKAPLSCPHRMQAKGFLAVPSCEAGKYCLLPLQRHGVSL